MIEGFKSRVLQWCLKHEAPTTLKQTALQGKVTHFAPPCQNSGSNSAPTCADFSVKFNPVEPNCAHCANSRSTAQQNDAHQRPVPNPTQTPLNRKRPRNPTPAPEKQPKKHPESKAPRVNDRLTRSMQVECNTRRLQRLLIAPGDHKELSDLDARLIFHNAVLRNSRAEKSSAKRP